MSQTLVHSLTKITSENRRAINILCKLPGFLQDFSFGEVSEEHKPSM